MADGLLMKLFQVVSKGIVLEHSKEGSQDGFYRMRA